MEGIREAYDGALAAFGEKVHAVGDDQWSAPTPCADWDVRTLVRHLVFENLWVPELFAGKTVAEVGDRFDGDILGEDPVRAWDVSAAAARDAVLAEGALVGSVHLSYGEAPGTEYAVQLFTDLVVHGWDLARGIGVDDTIDSAWVDALYEEMAPREDEIKDWGLFGPRVSPPEGADKQTKLLAVMGRVR
jgi:uncharacterized protein (TIGR03086 family)